MKAIDYYNKCLPINLCMDEAELYYFAEGLLVDFSVETKKIADERHTHRNAPLLAIIAEQNQKWNALVRIFKKNHGASPIKEDGFINYWNALLHPKKEKNEQ